MNQRADLIANAKKGSRPTNIPYVTTQQDRNRDLGDFAQAMGYEQGDSPMVTSWFSDNSPFAAFFK